MINGFKIPKNTEVVINSDPAHNLILMAQVGHKNKNNEQQLNDLRFIVESKYGDQIADRVVNIAKTKTNTEVRIKESFKVGKDEIYVESGMGSYRVFVDVYGY